MSNNSSEAVKCCKCNNHNYLYYYLYRNIVDTNKEEKRFQDGPYCPDCFMTIMDERHQREYFGYAQ